jgi:hypothetical protein
MTAVCVNLMRLDRLTDMELNSGPDESLSVALDLYQLENGF